jgi:uncharacterized protein (TIGR02001 family)
MKVIATTLAILFSFQAQADVSANLTFTDDYIYRGISNSDGGPAVQGGIDYYNDLGIYAGIWATTMDFQYAEDNPKYEFDVYGGISGEFKGLGWDVGFLRFVYPQAPDSYNLDAHEWHIGLSKAVNDIYIAAAYHYSPDYSGAGRSHYVETNIDIPLPYDFNLALHAGRQTFTDNEWYGMPDYTDWRVAVSRDIAGFDVELGWTDTNVNDDGACFWGTDWCASTVSIDVHRYFDLF